MQPQNLQSPQEEEPLKRRMHSEILQYIQDSSACLQWLRRQADIDSGLSPSARMTSNSGRRSVLPLKLSGLPGTEKWSEKKKKKKGALSDGEVGPRSLFRIQICSTEQMQQARGLETGTGKSTHQVRHEQNPENLWFPHLRRIHRQSLRGSPGALRAKGPQGILEPGF